MRHKKEEHGGLPRLQVGLGDEGCGFSLAFNYMPMTTDTYNLGNISRLRVLMLIVGCSYSEPSSAKNMQGNPKPGTPM